MSIFSTSELGRLDGVGLDWVLTGEWGGLEAVSSVETIRKEPYFLLTMLLLPPFIEVD